jgi:hypothetical protein
MLPHLKKLQQQIYSINFLIEERRPRVETKVFEIYEAYPL